VLKGLHFVGVHFDLFWLVSEDVERVLRLLVILVAVGVIPQLVDGHLFPSEIEVLDVLL